MSLELARALRDLQAAHARYAELMRGQHTCPAAWPADPPGPGYLGTRCQLLTGHDGAHRHRMTGSSVTVDWS